MKKLGNGLRNTCFSNVSFEIVRFLTIVLSIGAMVSLVENAQAQDPIASIEKHVDFPDKVYLEWSIGDFDKEIIRMFIVKRTPPEESPLHRRVPAKDRFYTDTEVVPGATYNYEILTVDKAGIEHPGVGGPMNIRIPVMVLYPTILENGNIDPRRRERFDPKRIGENVNVKDRALKTDGVTIDLGYKDLSDPITYGFEARSFSNRNVDIGLSLFGYGVPNDKPEVGLRVLKPTVFLSGEGRSASSDLVLPDIKEDQSGEVAATWRSEDRFLEDIPSRDIHKVKLKIEPGNAGRNRIQPGDGLVIDSFLCQVYLRPSP